MFLTSALVLAVLAVVVVAIGWQAEPPGDKSPLQQLLDELDRLGDENDGLRQELAAERLRANEATREL